MRYYIIALLIHLSIFFVSDKFLTLGKPELSKCTIPISYNVKNLPNRIDNIKKVKGSKAKKAAQEKKKVKKKLNKKPDTKKIKKKVQKKTSKKKKIKKEFKSKIKELKPREDKKVKKEVAPKKEEIVKKIVKPEKKPEEQKKVEEKEKPVETKKSKSKVPAKDAKDDIFSKNGNFTANADGSYTAYTAKGLDFKITNQIDPDYPRQAEIIRYNKTVVVEARFLVDTKGWIEKIEIIKSHKKFGFDKEVLKALRQWKFKPIVYKGKKMKVYFNKKFIFKEK